MKNSTYFVNQACEPSLDDDDVLFSFDVVSLFTKVLIDDALDEILQHLMTDEDLSEGTGAPIPVEDIPYFIE